MTIEDWQALGIVCGALLALITLAGLLWRKVVLPMLETARLVSTLVRQFVGDKDAKPPRPSLMEMVAGMQAGLEHQAAVQEQQAVRLAQVERGQAELREEWSTFRARSPVPGRPNGQQGRRG